jgi:hypothetical protein
MRILLAILTVAMLCVAGNEIINYFKEISK